MILRTLCLLTLLVAVTGVSAADDPPAAPQQPPAAANAAAQVESPAQPAEVQPNADQPTANQADTTQAATEAQQQAPAQPRSQSQILQQRVDDLLRDPGPVIDRAAVQTQLDDLTLNASQLAVSSDDARTRFDALSVELQSLYTRLVEYPSDPNVDHLLSQMRASARMIKTVDLPDQQPGAVGDFWLMTAELYDMNRTKLAAVAKRKQAAALMKDFLDRHGDWPPAMDVRQSLEQLQKAADASQPALTDQEHAQPAPAPAPAPEQKDAAEPANQPADAPDKSQ